MNTLVGYTVIQVGGVDMPLKFGSYAIRNFLKEMGIDLNQFGSLFNELEVNGKKLPIPKDPILFAVTVLWCGADYAHRAQGGAGYQHIEAYEWLDQLGGIDSEQMKAVYKPFFESILNGGTPLPEMKTEEGKKKGSKPKP